MFNELFPKHAHQYIANGEYKKFYEYINDKIANDIITNKNIKEQLFCYSLECGYFWVIDFFLEIGSDINVSFSLMYLSERLIKNAKMIEKLFNYGLDINAKLSSGISLAMRVARSGKKKTMKYLIKNGADLNYKMGVSTAFEYSLERESSKMMELLIENGYGSVLSGIEMTLYGVINDIPWLIDYGLNKYNIDINSSDKKGNSFLMIAVKEGATESFNHLIKRGININSVNKKGRTALTYSLKEENNYWALKKLVLTAF